MKTILNGGVARVFRLDILDTAIVMVTRMRLGLARALQ